MGGVATSGGVEQASPRGPGSAAVGPRALGHVEALDGIRAVAVLAVIGFHAGWSRTPAGFLGVDVFLVLSGFLITRLLVDEVLATGTVRRTRFWARRARRLLPALLLVITAVAAWAALFGTAAERTTIRADGLASLLYVQNWHLVARQTSYFAQFSSPSPFLHLWSLAVEEQWYLVWPLLLLGLLRLARNRLAVVGAITVVLALASATLMAVLHHPGTDPSRVYFGTDTRAQALLLGATLAFVTVARRTAWSRRRWLLDGLGLAGLVFLAWVVTGAHERSAWLYRGGFTGVALAATAVVAAGLGDGLVARGLACRPLPQIGRISYGLYLWSWPCTVLLAPARTGWSASWCTVAQLVTTFAAAALSYHLLERPVREQRWTVAVRPSRWAPVAAVAVVGFVLVGTSGVVAARPPTAVEVLASGTGRPGALARLHTVAPASRPPAAPTAMPATATPAGAPATPVAAPPPVVFVDGDSFAYSLGVMLPAGLAGAVRLEGATVPGCGMQPGPALDGDLVQPFADACATRPRLVREAIAHAGAVDVAILVPTAWDVFDREVDGVRVPFGSPRSATLVADSLEEEWRALAPLHVPIVVLTQPCYGRFTDGRAFGSATRAEPWRVAFTNQVLRSWATSHPADVRVADLFARLCPHGAYDDDVGGVRARPDGVHLTAEGGAGVWRWLLPIVDRAAGIATVPSAAPRAR